MTQYILRRLIITVPILFGLTIITFTLTELMPGDFVDAMVPPEQKVALTPDQLWGISASWDRTLRLWPLGEGGRPCGAPFSRWTCVQEDGDRLWIDRHGHYP